MLAFVRELPCLVCERQETERRHYERVHPHHVRTRGAGGKDVGNVVPLCGDHHGGLHAVGRGTFEKLHGVDLVALAEGVTMKWRASGDFLSLADDPPVWGSN